MKQSLIFRKYCLTICFFFTVTSSVFPSLIYTNLTQDSLTVGDRIQLTVSVVVPQGAQVIPPETHQGFGNLVVKSWNTETVQRNRSDSVSFQYVLTAYTVEPCSLPPLPFIQINENRPDTLYSDPRAIRIISVITAQEGDTIGLKDIKPPLITGTPSLIWVWVLLGIVGAVGIIMLIRYWLEKRKRPPLPPPPKPPYEEAKEALKALERKQYLVKGMIREFIFELSEILKRYLGRRYESNALEYTTEEILEWIGTAPIDSTLKRTVEWFFNITHPVKFARMVPDSTTVKQLYDEVSLFVERTRPGMEQSEDNKKPEEARP